MWNGIDSPLGITANSKGGTLVNERVGNIIRFDANGQRHKLVAQNELNALRCIAVDDDDNSCCIDEDNNKILTYVIRMGVMLKYTKSSRRIVLE